MKPAINLPFVDPELRRTLEAIKENLEVITGRRGGKAASLTNNAERWQDELAALSNARPGAGASTTPQWAVFRNGLYGWAFEDTHDDELWTYLHVGHLYKPDTPLYLHVHWAVNAALTGAAYWELEYTLARGHGQQAFGASVTVPLIQSLPSGVAANNQYVHMIAEMTDAQAIQASAGLEPDTLIMVRLARRASQAQDTINEGISNKNVFAFFVDAHYQVDGNFTTTKRPAWVKNTDEHGATLDKINEILDKLQ